MGIAGAVSKIIMRMVKEQLGRRYTLNRVVITTHKNSALIYRGRTVLS